MPRVVDEAVPGHGGEEAAHAREAGDVVVRLEEDAVDPGEVGALEQHRLGALDVADDEVDRLVAQQRVEAHGRHLDGAEVRVRAGDSEPIQKSRRR